MQELTLVRSLLLVLSQAGVVAGICLVIIFWLIRLALKGIKLEHEKAINEKASKKALEELEERMNNKISKLDDKNRELELLITKNLK